MTSELFLAHHLFLYEASERGLGMSDKEERPPKPTFAGAVHPPPNLLSMVLPEVVSRF